MYRVVKHEFLTLVTAYSGEIISSKANLLSGRGGAGGMGTPVGAINSTLGPYFGVLSVMSFNCPNPAIKMF